MCVYYINSTFTSIFVGGSLISVKGGPLTILPEGRTLSRMALRSNQHLGCRNLHPGGIWAGPVSTMKRNKTWCSTPLLRSVDVFFDSHKWCNSRYHPSSYFKLPTSLYLINHHDNVKNCYVRDHKRAPIYADIAWDMNPYEGEFSRGSVDDS